MRAGEPNPGENIAAESNEPDKEGGGGPSTTEKNSMSPKLITVIVALIGLVGLVVAAVITGRATIVAAEINHGLNSAAPASPPHPEASGDMPVPNCPTCISGGRTFPEQADGGSAKPTYRNPLVFGGLGQFVKPGEKVEVVCRFHQPDAPPSVVHDGWWYLIASPPWNRNYYTVANSYLNGDLPPYDNKVDNGVPVCTAGS